MQKAQRVFAPFLEARQQIVPGPPRRAPPRFAVSFRRGARQRRLLFVKGEAFSNNRIITSLDAIAIRYGSRTAILLR